MSGWADRSETISELLAAFVAAQKQMINVGKGRRANAGQFGYNYADLSDVLSDVRPVLTVNGLGITQTAEVVGDDVILWTTLVHTSGQFITAAPTRLAAGKTAQQTGSSITYARRYSLLAMLGVAAADDDDDGASAGVRSVQEGKPYREAGFAPEPVQHRAVDERPDVRTDRPASEKQRNYAKALMRTTVPDWSPPDNWTAAEASQLIEELKAEQANG